MNYVKIFATTLLVFSSKLVLAETLSDTVALDVMKNLTATQYWSKGPSSVLLYCNDKYPNKVANDLYIKWFRKNANYDTRIDSLNNYFAPLMAQKTESSEDEWNLHLTKMVDKIISSRVSKDIDSGQLQYLCGDGFTQFLDDMFSKDIIKPRVTIAADNLEKIKQNLSKQK